MIKNILSVLIFLFSIIFFYFVTSTYFSMAQKKKITENRKTVIQKIENNISGLPILVTDTNNIIEFNSGFENENNKIKRNFWKLFKQHD